MRTFNPGWWAQAASATPGPDVLTIDDTYIATLALGVVFNQGLVVTQSFNTPSAYSALATAGLMFPVYKRLGFNLCWT